MHFRVRRGNGRNMTHEVHTLLLVVTDPIRAVSLLEYAAGVGMDVLGPAESLAKVRALLRRRTPDAALIDCTNFGDCNAVMDLLSADGIPFMVVQDSEDKARKVDAAALPANDVFPIQLDEFAGDLVVVQLPQDPAARARLQTLIANASSGE